MQRFYTRSEAFTYRADTPGVPTQYDVTDNQQVSTRILEAVADQRGVDPLELQPLYEVVDPEALEAVFSSTVVGGNRGGRIEFTYAGCRITITAGADRAITVEDSTQQGRDRDRNPGRKQLME